MGTTYSVTCDCGATSPIEPRQAGSTVPCPCGRDVAVPSLSRLRQSTGQAAYETGIIDTIRRLIEDGELPTGRTCVLSGMPTTDTADVLVRCTSKVLQRGRTGQAAGWIPLIIFSLLIPFGFLLRWALHDHEDREAVELGHDRDTVVVLPVRREEQDAFRRIRSQGRLRRLLRTEPMYARLLKEYPKAVIQAGSAHG